MLFAVIVIAPILFIAAVAIGALSFSGPSFEPQPTLAQMRETESKSAGIALVDSAPRLETQVPVEQVLLKVEEHLRTERERAARFSRNPSAAGLSAN